MRKAEIKRKTRETGIVLMLNLDGTGDSRIDVRGFIGHMLDAMARHGMFDLRVEAEAFLDPDGHHLTEDLGIVLGEAIRLAVRDGRGLARYGHAVIPMDDALVEVALDLSGRPFCRYDLGEMGKQAPASLLEEFFLGFTRKAGATLHLRALSGHDPHHLGEAAFKAFGRALRQAVSIDGRLGDDCLSTKGCLS